MPRWSDHHHRRRGSIPGTSFTPPPPPQPQVPIHRASSSFWKEDFVSLQRMVGKVKVEQDKRQAQSSHRAHEEEAVETSSSSSSSGNSSWKTIGSKYLLCWSNEQRNGQGGQEFVWKAGRGRGKEEDARNEIAGRPYLRIVPTSQIGGDTASIGAVVPQLYTLALCLVCWKSHTR